MKKIILAALIFANTAFAEEYAMPNIDGGEVVLTDIPCLYEYSDTFPFYTYATVNDQVVDEGCWNSPSLEGSPRNAFAIVNVNYSGYIVHYPQYYFKRKENEETTVSVTNP